MYNYEHCNECDALTGRAGKHDDSLYHAHEGPFCVDCYEAWDEEVIVERDTLRTKLDEARELLDLAMCKPYGRWDLLDKIDAWLEANKPSAKA